MEKKIFLCFAIAAVVGISAWAFILGGTVSYTHLTLPTTERV